MPNKYNSLANQLNGLDPIPDPKFDKENVVKNIIIRLLPHRHNHKCRIRLLQHLHFRLRKYF